MASSNNFFSDFLQEVPQAAFYSGMPSGTSPRQRRFFEDQYNPMRNRYMGALGQQIRQGQTPTLNFTDFLNQPSPRGGGMSPLNQAFMEQPRYNRGMSAPSFNPRTRFLYGF